MTGEVRVAREGALARVVSLLLKARGNSCDVMDDFCYPFAVSIFLQFLGISTDMLPLWQDRDVCRRDLHFFPAVLAALGAPECLKKRTSRRLCLLVDMAMDSDLARSRDSQGLD